MMDEPGISNRGGGSSPRSKQQILALNSLSKTDVALDTSAVMNPCRRSRQEVGDGSVFHSETAV